MRNNKMSLKETLAYKKSKMLPLNFKLLYVFTPVYIVVSFSLIAAFAILMLFDSERFFVLSMVLLSVFVAALITMFLLIPIVRSRAVKFEMKRYSFDISDEPELEEWDFSRENFSLVFKSCGMFLNGEFHHFDLLQKIVVTNNQHGRINIFLIFIISESEYVYFELDDPRILKMIESFRIKMDNELTFRYILENKEAAFKKIYDKGFVSA